jgi:hypothetical protein
VCNGHEDTVSDMTTPEEMRANAMSTMMFLDKKLPKGVFVCVCVCVCVTVCVYACLCLCVVCHTVSDMITPDEMRANAMSTMMFLDKKLPKGVC